MCVWCALRDFVFVCVCVFGVGVHAECVCVVYTSCLYVCGGRGVCVVC